MRQTRSAVATSYFYDLVERPLSWTDDLAGTEPDVTTTLGYNAANQITSRTVNNDTYVFSGYTNANRGYSANGLNQYSNVGGASFGYDSNGNLTSDGSTNTIYTYDSENRLLTASTHSAALTYDPLGRLFQIAATTGTTQFLYDGDELVAEYDGTGALQKRYVHGPKDDDPLIWYEGAAVSSSTRRSLQANYQGSIQSVADASGAPLSVNRYDEYGVPASTNLGRFQYTGQAWMPELGLYYYKARVYDPRLGRFLQTDPVGYKDDLDLYAYVGNDPLDRTDPSGNCDDPHQVGCPTKGKPQDSSQGHAAQSAKMMKQMVEDAKAAGDTNLQGSFNRQTTAATDGNVVSTLKPDATLQSTSAEGTRFLESERSLTGLETNHCHGISQDKQDSGRC